MQAKILTDNKKNASLQPKLRCEKRWVNALPPHEDLGKEYEKWNFPLSPSPPKIWKLFRGQG